jgi:glutathione synthase/RimK-type ligase-like ATP-grasp enzyme
MNHIKVTISHQLHESSSLPVISISNNVLKQLNIPVDHPLHFRFSTQSHPVICKVNQSKGSLIQMDELFAKRLRIPNGCQIHINYDVKQKEISIGPVVAILVSSYFKVEPPFGGLDSFCKELIQVAHHRHILAYVVTLRECIDQTETVKGWRYFNNKWAKEELPFPEIIYNRIGSRKMEQTSKYEDFMQNMQDQNVHLFNQAFLNKWDVHSILRDSKKLQSSLPDTHLFGPLALKTMLEKNTVVFVKPTQGALGRGIYRITKKSYGFESQYTTPNGQVQKQFDRLSKLYNYLSRRVNSKRFIVQQGIPIIQIQGRPIDFRALMQKNSSGDWAVTSMVARIGPLNRFVSNIARGGELSKVLQTLRLCNIPQPKKVRANLLKVAKVVCEGLEESHPDKFGELGVDLAISKSGHIYLLEVNSKPSKTEDTVSPMSQSKGRPSVHRLLDYSLYLMNKSSD